MVDIPEHLLLRSAEARAKALGISVEQALAEMKGESEPTVVAKEPEVKEEAPAAEVKEEAPAAEVIEAAPTAEEKEKAGSSFYKNLKIIINEDIF